MKKTAAKAKAAAKSKSAATKPSKSAKPVKSAKPSKSGKTKVAAKASKAVAKKPAVKAKVAKKPAAKKVTKKVAKKPAAKKLVAKKPAAKKLVARTPATKVKAKAPTKTKAVAKPKSVAKPKAVSKARKAPVVTITPPKRPLAAPTPSQALLDLIVTQLDEAKAEDIVTLNLEGKSTLADTMVVASGRSNRHVGAIADQLVEKLKANGYKDLRVEGLEQSDWVVVDTSDVIVHLFRPEVRSFYNLERLWSEHSPRETPTA